MTDEMLSETPCRQLVKIIIEFSSVLIEANIAAGQWSASQKLFFVNKLNL